jgi:hypothetical protein
MPRLPKRPPKLKAKEGQTVTTYGTETGLPTGCLIKIYSTMRDLMMAAKSVLDTLIENSEEGNQYILVLDLPKSAIRRLQKDTSA